MGLVLPPSLGPICEGGIFVFGASSWKSLQSLDRVLRHVKLMLKLSEHAVAQTVKAKAHQASRAILRWLSSAHLCCCPTAYHGSHLDAILDCLHLPIFLQVALLLSERVVLFGFVI